MSGDPAPGFFAREGAAPPRRPVHPVRLVLAGAVVVLAAVVLVPTRAELLYHLHAPPPVDLGAVAGLPPSASIPGGARVQAHAVLGNHAAEIPLWRRGSLRFGPIVVRQVMGAPLFVEYDPALHPTWGPFVEVEVDARVLSFDDAALDQARAVLVGQGMPVAREARVLVVDERPGQMQRYPMAWTGGLALAILAVRSLRGGSLRGGSVRQSALPPPATRG
ncbi:MAG: hypothetical protein A2138_04520 [Deltaproteobacteria bacterium RBG_16_71_12]|nr:MAG: hypothetical protein A2138_04520 [Deltaproteobacteria bacterium RBG_16_71_12]